MYLLKSQIPAYKALSKKQRKTVRSAFHRKHYSWRRNSMPNVMFFLFVLWASTQLHDHSKWSGPIALLIFCFLQLAYKCMLSVVETNQLSNSVEFIETTKDHEWGF